MFKEEHIINCPFCGQLTIKTYRKKSYARRIQGSFTGGASVKASKAEYGISSEKCCEWCEKV